LIPSFSAAFKGANKGLFSGMNSGVNQKVSRSKERFSTARKLADMRLLSLMMSSAVVNQVALGSELSETSILFASEQFGFAWRNIEATKFQQILRHNVASCSKDFECHGEIQKKKDLHKKRKGKYSAVQRLLSTRY
jgi:hypothetical protein